ncbi:hypothetical protein QFZ75_002351 [Streptomyces sp. V3I8]|nr:hypothetical protein [Streptomyces sp. V3I8]
MDLLSHHLCSSPRVHLRELLQNAVDAVTARRAEQPDAPARVRLYAGDGTLRGEDSGIGRGPACRAWTAGELAVHARVEALSPAGRFDERNGTARVSGRVRGRMDQRPLVERLPLGIHAARTVTASAPASASAPISVRSVSAPDAGPDLPGLLAEARRLARSLHPDSVAAWAAVAEAERLLRAVGGG